MTGNQKAFWIGLVISAFWLGVDLGEIVGATVVQK